MLSALREHSGQVIAVLVPLSRERQFSLLRTHALCPSPSKNGAGKLRILLDMPGEDWEQGVLAQLFQGKHRVMVLVEDNRIHGCQFKHKIHL